MRGVAGVDSGKQEISTKHTLTTIQGQLLLISSSC